MSKKRNKHFYAHSDGNGGYNISKKLTLLVTIITLMTFFGNIVYGYGTLNQKVVKIEDVIKEVKVHHPQYVEQTENRLDMIETQNAVIDQKLLQISNDLKYIREQLGG